MKSMKKWTILLSGVVAVCGALVGCSGGDPAPVTGDNEAAKQVVGDTANNAAMAERAKQKEATMGQVSAAPQNNNSLRGQ